MADTPTTTALEPREWTHPWQAAFLEALALMPNVSAACQRVGVSRPRVYQVRESDPAFAEAWANAVDVGVDLLERIAHARATTGEPKVTTRRTVKKEGGKVVEEVEVVEETTLISNALLIFLLKAHRPTMYRERIDHRHLGPDGAGPVQVEVYREPTRERMLELAALAQELELPSGQVVPAVIESSASKTA